MGRVTPVSPVEAQNREGWAGRLKMAVDVLVTAFDNLITAWKSSEDQTPSEITQAFGEMTVLAAQSAETFHQLAEAGITTSDAIAALGPSLSALCAHQAAFSSTLGIQDAIDGFDAQVEAWSETDEYLIGFPDEPSRELRVAVLHRLLAGNIQTHRGTIVSARIYRQALDVTSHGDSTPRHIRGVRRVVLDVIGDERVVENGMLQYSHALAKQYSYGFDAGDRRVVFSFIPMAFGPSGAGQIRIEGELRADWFRDLGPIPQPEPIIIETPPIIGRRAIALRGLETK